MCRRAAIAYLLISVWPNGASHCSGPREPHLHVADAHGQILRIH